jgi:hypothetical protein
VHNTFSRIGLGIVMCLFFGSATAMGQTHRVEIFPNEQEYYLAFKNLPQTNQLNTTFTLLDAHVNKGLGAEFNQITSLTAIFCRKNTAISAMQKSISELLAQMHFQVLSDWDPMFGTLRASLTGRALINSSPPEFQRLNLKIQVDQAKYGQRAFIIDYEILASPQVNNDSWADISSTSEARNYIDELRVKIRARVEQALKDQCEKATVRDIPNEEEALQALAIRLKMKPAEVEALRAALRERHE